MRFTDNDYAAPPQDLVRAIVRLLPDYLPGKETGPVTITDRRSCWIKTTRRLLETLGREHHVQITVEDVTDFGGSKQLKMLWKRGDSIVLAAVSGWGDREELEQSFVHLEWIKAPQKLLLYTCARWQDAVLDQLSAALLRYPHHIEGEQYIAINLLGAEMRVVVHSRQVPHSGTLSLAEAGLQMMQGSPFFWPVERVAGRRP